MRTIGLLSMTALILTGLPPTAIGPSPAAAMQQGRRTLAPRDDPDARCAPFFGAFNDREDDYAGGGAAGAATPAPRWRRSRCTHRRRRPPRRNPRHRWRRRRTARSSSPAPACAGRTWRASRPSPSVNSEEVRLQGTTRRESRQFAPAGPGRPGLCPLARQSRALHGRGGGRRAGRRRRAGLDLLDRRRHRLLRQCPADAERGHACRRRPRCAPRRC